MDYEKWYVKDVPAKSLCDKNWTQEELLVWINGTLEKPVKKIPDLCTGAFYCQMLEELFPGIMPMQQVKTAPRYQREYLENFKIFQSALKTLNIKKDVPISRLIRGELVPNFKFLAWFKTLHDLNSNLNSNLFNDPNMSAEDKVACLKNEIEELDNSATDVTMERDLFKEKTKRLEELFKNAETEPTYQISRDLLGQFSAIILRKQ